MKYYAEEDIIHTIIELTNQSEAWVRNTLFGTKEADVAPVVHAYWVKGQDNEKVFCSACSIPISGEPDKIKKYFKICFNCGAKMDVEEPESNHLTKTVVVRKGFSYKEEYDKKTDSLHVVNSDGCDWCDGVGVNPHGCFCGECDMICKEECAARTRLSDDEEEEEQ